MKSMESAISDYEKKKKTTTKTKKKENEEEENEKKESKMLNAKETKHDFASEHCV
jgi:hypothetical protein